MRDPARPGRSRTAAACIALLACGAAGAQVADDGQAFGGIERGRYLTLVADCAACHDDPADGRPFAGGRPIETPFGTVVAPNITPDRDTGIGAWTDGQFDAALRRGIMPDGARLYPAMPFAYYTRMSRADVLAIRAYLATIAPVRHPVDADRLPFPFNIRAAMRVWDALYFNAGEYRPDPAKSAVWNRGAFLVQGPGHCGACHTPKTALGGDRQDHAFEGYAIQGWFAPNITDDAHRGLAAWSARDIVQYLKTGHNRFDAASGPMGEEVAISSSHMTDDDLGAIANYLKDQGGNSPASTPLPRNDPVMAAGAAIYGDLCAACHRADGRGIPYLFPNLAASAAVAAPEPTTLLQVVIRGAQGVATAPEPTNAAMPSFGWQLSDVQVAAVSTYVRNSWGHAAPAVSAGAVGKARAALVTARN